MCTRVSTYFLYDIALLSTCFVSFGPIQHSIALVVMETKVSTLVIWLFWTFIEGIRLNIKILS